MKPTPEAGQQLKVGDRVEMKGWAKVKYPRCVQSGVLVRFCDSELLSEDGCPTHIYIRRGKARTPDLWAAHEWRKVQ